MKTTLKVSLVLLLTLPKSTEGKRTEDHNLSLLFANQKAHTCAENGVVSAWCDSSLSKVQCLIHPDSDVYACQCNADPAACPDECIDTDTTDTKPSVRTHHGIVCNGIPTDEPNYVLKTDSEHLPSLHHCENNSVVANWCNEVPGKKVNCLLLPSLNEYVCTCVGNAAACPSECVGGGKPDRKTHHAIRCTGIPEDSPNYVVGN